jgi:hypothetical protein
MDTDLINNQYNTKKSKYLAKLEYLHSEYFTIKKCIDESLPEFKKNLILICNDSKDSKDSDKDTVEHKVKIPNQNDLELDNDDQDETYKIITKLYYKLSKYIHPDKTNDQIKIAFFSLCKQSKESKILYKLLLIAKKFDIDFNLTDKEYSILDEEILMLNNNINEIQGNYVYQWLNESQPEKKQQILLNYILNKNL